MRSQREQNHEPSHNYDIKFDNKFVNYTCNTMNRVATIKSIRKGEKNRVALLCSDTLRDQMPRYRYVHTCPYYTFPTCPLFFLTLGFLVFAASIVGTASLLSLILMPRSLATSLRTAKQSSSKCSEHSEDDFDLEGLKAGRYFRTKFFHAS